MKKLTAIIIAIAIACTMLSFAALASEQAAVFPGGSGDGGAQQLNNAGPIAVVITVPEGYYMYEIIGLASPTWTQKVGCDAAVEIYPWTGDYEESVFGDVIAYGEVHEHQDNQDAVFVLNNNVSAGTYLAEFSAIGTGPFGFWSFSDAGDDNAIVFQSGNEVSFYPKVALTLMAEGTERDPVEPDSIVFPGQYMVSHTLNKSNAKTWTNGDIGDAVIKYCLKVNEEGLNVGIVAEGANDGDMIQLNFNPENKLAETPGLFVSFVVGDQVKVLQHNHKTALMDDDSAAGVDITDKVQVETVKKSKSYEIKATLPVDLFKVTDVDGLADFVVGTAPLYYGMFCVLGNHGYTNQSGAPGSDWTCNGLGLTEYSIINPKWDKTVFYLYDADFSVSTGWWLNPLLEGAAVTVEFTSDVWFKGIGFYAYGADIEAHMTISLEDESGDVVYEYDLPYKDNKSYIVNFDKSFAPGDYIINFIGGNTDDLAKDVWFVLGSAPVNEDIGEVYVSGGNTNGDTKGAPYMHLIVGEADPNVTEKPTKEPATDAPATDVPATPVPTDAPVQTDVPGTDNAGSEATTQKTEAGSETSEKKSGNTGAIIGIAVAAAVIVAAVVVIIIASKKKK